MKKYWDIGLKILFIRHSTILQTPPGAVKEKEEEHHEVFNRNCKKRHNGNQ